MISNNRIPILTQIWPNIFLLKTASEETRDLVPFVVMFGRVWLDDQPQIWKRARVSFSGAGAIEATVGWGLSNLGKQKANKNGSFRNSEEVF